MAETMINQINNRFTNELPKELSDEVNNQSIYGTAAVEFMTAQLIECVKQTHTHQIQVTLADDSSMWKVTIEKVNNKANSLGNSQRSGRAA